MFKLDPEEKVILELRKHWFVIFFQGLFLFLVALAPALAVYLVVKFYPIILEFNFGGPIIYLFSFFYFIWLLVIWVIFFVEWTDYYLDVWYVTPKRIVAIDQKGLFRREVIDLRFEKVQDATVEISGLIETLLNFGDIHVQTAGAGREIKLRSAKNPHEAKRTILSRHSQALESSERLDHSIKNE